MNCAVPCAPALLTTNGLNRDSAYGCGRAARPGRSALRLAGRPRRTLRRHEAWDHALPEAVLAGSGAWSAPLAPAASNAGQAEAVVPALSGALAGSAQGGAATYRSQPSSLRAHLRDTRQSRSSRCQQCTHRERELQRNSRPLRFAHCDSETRAAPPRPSQERADGRTSAPRPLLCWKQEPHPALVLVVRRGRPRWPHKSWSSSYARRGNASSRSPTRTVVSKRKHFKVATD